MLERSTVCGDSGQRIKEAADLDRWCRHIANVGCVTGAIIVLGHVIWYFAARSVLAWPPDVYLWNYIIFPAIGFLCLSLLVGICVRRARVALSAKKYLSIAPFMIFSLYLSLSHDISKIMLCTYVLPIFGSSIFSDIKLTRRAFYVSVIAVLLPGVKLYFAGKLNSDMVMEIFAAEFMFCCSYLMVKVLIRFSRESLVSMIRSHEEATKNELAFLQAQIKPHFLYNAINTIISFCYTDGERAATLLANFSKYLRRVFDIDHNSMMIDLEREIELTKAYVEIEKARFGELIQVEYNIEPELLDMKIPSFCVQPFVENAIKHGLWKKAGGGIVRISVKKNDESVVIMVSDTGIGMTAERLDKLRNPEAADGGVGLFNTERRIRNWEGARLAIASTEGEGTTITITISTLPHRGT